MAEIRSALSVTEVASQGKATELIPDARLARNIPPQTAQKPSPKRGRRRAGPLLVSLSAPLLVWGAG
ncbi:hypothetical protein GCM10018987_06050 [Streptomyces cremeus]